MQPRPSDVHKIAELSAQLREQRSRIRELEDSCVSAWFVAGIAAILLGAAIVLWVAR